MRQSVMNHDIALLKTSGVVSLHILPTQFSYLSDITRTRRASELRLLTSLFGVKASKNLSPEKELICCIHVKCIIPHILESPARSSCTSLQHVRICSGAVTCWCWCTECVNPSYQPVLVNTMPVPFESFCITPVTCMYFCLSRPTNPEHVCCTVYCSVPVYT